MDFFYINYACTTFFLLLLYTVTIFFFALSEQFRTAVFLLLICFNFVFIFVSLLYLKYVLKEKQLTRGLTRAAEEAFAV